MLHDPRHDRTPTLAGFALFVASKEPSEKYEWMKACHCAVGQYAKSIDSDYWRIIHHRDMDIANSIAMGARTFGELADRILTYQRKHG